MVDATSLFNASNGDTQLRVLRGRPVLQALLLGAADSKRRNCPCIRGVLFGVPVASMTRRDRSVTRFKSRHSFSNRNYTRLSQSRQVSKTLQIEFVARASPSSNHSRFNRNESCLNKYSLRCNVVVASRRSESS